MAVILNTLANTPWWAFALFAVVTWFGIRGLRPRTVPLWRLLITPAIFIGWGLVSLVRQSVSSPVLIADWSAAAAIGAIAAWAASRLGDVGIDRTRRLVSLPGSAFPLIRNFLIFSARYGLGVATAIAPAARADIAIWNIAVSGASAGYFLGWLARLAWAYRRAPDSNAPSHP
jgi:hypothetical protein